MIDEVKDSVANVTTIGAVSAVMIDWSTVLTMTLLITGIILNVVRVIEIKRKSKKDS
tara:strand:+ start:534 stop:704 length:171 start_codon:yes stop_codon:yes gene_type:complete